MGHSGKRLEFASCDEIERIDRLLAAEPPKLSIIEGAAPKKLPHKMSEQEMKLHKLRSDEKVKFIYGKNSKTIHDKACPNLKGMAGNSLCTSEVFLMHLKPCEQCFLKACIRAGGNVAEVKEYQKYFDAVDMKDNLLRRIYLIDGMKSEIAGHVLTLKFDQDTWKLKLAGRGKSGTPYVDLFQNNYRVNGVKREFVDGFHLACRKMSMREAIGYIESYVWRKPDKAPLPEKWSVARIVKIINHWFTKTEAIYYIDGDNLVQERLVGIETLNEACKVKIFSSRNGDYHRNHHRQRKLRARCKCQIEFYTVVPGKDAADFAIAMDLGREIGTGNRWRKPCRYYLISGDKHFDVIDRQIDQLTKYKAEVRWMKRIADVNEGRVKESTLEKYLYIDESKEDYAARLKREYQDFE